MLSKFLDPKNDYAFKQIFGTEKNQDILIHFISVFPFELSPSLAPFKLYTIVALGLDCANFFMFAMALATTRKHASNK
jgi:hypothetical protein